MENLQVVEIEGERRYLATAGWTMVWYAIPCVLYAVWLLVTSGKPGASCGTCPGPIHTLLHDLPRIGAAMVLSVLVAMLLRLGSAAWRPLTTGFVAAVIGAGGATILFSVV